MPIIDARCSFEGGWNLPDIFPLFFLLMYGNTGELFGRKTAVFEFLISNKAMNIDVFFGGEMDKGIEKWMAEKRKETLLKGFITFQVLGDIVISPHTAFKSHRNFPMSFPQE